MRAMPTPDIVVDTEKLAPGEAADAIILAMGISRAVTAT
jgi:hypothetical protein